MPALTYLPASPAAAASLRQGDTSTPPSEGDSTAAVRGASSLKHALPPLRSARPTSSFPPQSPPTPETTPPGTSDSAAPPTTTATASPAAAMATTTTTTAAPAGMRSARPKRLSGAGTVPQRSNSYTSRADSFKTAREDWDSEDDDEEVGRDAVGGEEGDDRSPHFSSAERFAPPGAFPSSVGGGAGGRHGRAAGFRASSPAAMLPPSPPLPRHSWFGDAGYDYLEGPDDDDDDATPTATGEVTPRPRKSRSAAGVDGAADEGDGDSADDGSGGERDAGRMRHVTVRRRRPRQQTHPAPNGLRTSPDVDDMKRAYSLRERAEKMHREPHKPSPSKKHKDQLQPQQHHRTQRRQRTPPSDQFDPEVGWPHETMRDRDAKRLSAASNASTSSAVVEAALVFADGAPPSRRQTLRHVRKNQALRSESGGSISSLGGITVTSTVGPSSPVAGERKGLPDSSLASSPSTTAPTAATTTADSTPTPRRQPRLVHKRSPIPDRSHHRGASGSSLDAAAAAAPGQRNVSSPAAFPAVALTYGENDAPGSGSGSARGTPRGLRDDEAFERPPQPPPKDYPPLAGARGDGARGLPSVARRFADAQQLGAAGGRGRTGESPRRAVSLGGGTAPPTRFREPEQKVLPRFLPASAVPQFSRGAPSSRWTPEVPGKAEEGVAAGGGGGGVGRSASAGSRGESFRTAGEGKGEERKRQEHDREREASSKVEQPPRVSESKGEDMNDGSRPVMREQVREPASAVLVSSPPRVNDDPDDRRARQESTSPPSSQPANQVPPSFSPRSPRRASTDSDMHSYHRLRPASIDTARTVALSTPGAAPVTGDAPSSAARLLRAHTPHSTTSSRFADTPELLEATAVTFVPYSASEHVTLVRRNTLPLAKAESNGGGAFERGDVELEVEEDEHAPAGPVVAVCAATPPPPQPPPLPKEQHQREQEQARPEGHDEERKADASAAAPPAPPVFKVIPPTPCEEDDDDEERHQLGGSARPRGEMRDGGAARPHPASRRRSVLQRARGVAAGIRLDVSRGWRRSGVARAVSARRRGPTRYYYYGAEGAGADGSDEEEVEDPTGGRLHPEWRPRWAARDEDEYFSDEDDEVDEEEALLPRAGDGEDADVDVDGLRGGPRLPLGGDTSDVRGESEERAQKGRWRAVVGEGLGKRLEGLGKAKLPGTAREKTRRVLGRGKRWGGGKEKGSRGGRGGGLDGAADEDTEGEGELDDGQRRGGRRVRETTVDIDEYVIERVRHADDDDHHHHHRYHRLEDDKEDPALAPSSANAVPKDKDENDKNAQKADMSAASVGGSQPATGPGSVASEPTTAIHDDDVPAPAADAPGAAQAGRDARRDSARDSAGSQNPTTAAAAAKPAATKPAAQAPQLPPIETDVALSPKAGGGGGDDDHRQDGALGEPIPGLLLTSPTMPTGPASTSPLELPASPPPPPQSSGGDDGERGADPLSPATAGPPLAPSATAPTPTSARRPGGGLHGRRISLPGNWVLVGPRTWMAELERARAERRGRRMRDSGISGPVLQRPEMGWSREEWGRRE
ncbi:hypothetical protein BDY21DRAFT_371147 [Lineolata rhizophorae]|uniref:Uncharacterized protein n=1 Tax=Lineolata rhizophorae TaxID=578093 RepID=A0A6A6P2P8_9PEZI|nr:hypothetical protein BDY21DRAFT_371147 [Lineolata rhizophorae]